MLIWEEKFWQYEVRWVVVEMGRLDFFKILNILMDIMNKGFE